MRTPQFFIIHSSFFTRRSKASAPCLPLAELEGKVSADRLTDEVFIKSFAVRQTLIWSREQACLFRLLWFLTQLHTNADFKYSVDFSCRLICYVSERASPFPTGTGDSFGRAQAAVSCLILMRIARHGEWPSLFPTGCGAVFGMQPQHCTALTGCEMNLFVSLFRYRATRDMRIRSCVNAPLKR